MASKRPAAAAAARKRPAASEARPAPKKRPAAAVQAGGEGVGGASEAADEYDRVFDWQSAPARLVELHFNPRKSVAFKSGSHMVDAYISKFSVASASLLQDFPFAPGEENISYGSSPRQVLSLHRPKSPSGAAVMFIHGGYWRALDKEQHYFCADGFLRYGITVVNVDHDLCPAVHLDDIAAQIVRCFHFVQDNLASWGLDPARFYLAGHSAGAHLAALLLSDPRRAGRVAGAHLMSGIYETPVVLRLPVNAEVRLTEVEAARNNMLFRPPLHSVPVCVSFGGDEPAGWKQQSRAYEALARGAGCKTLLLECRSCDHFSMLFDCVGAPRVSQFESWVRMAHSPSTKADGASAV